MVWGFAPTQESWRCHRVPGKRPLDFANRSRREAWEWIAAFPRENVLFAIEFDTQDAAAEARGHGSFIDDAG